MRSFSPLTQAGRYPHDVPPDLQTNQA